MDSFVVKFTVSILVLFGCGAKADTPQKSIFDITKYGGKTSDTSDINQALLKAWKEACASPTYSQILIPQGKYLLKEIELLGPCKAPLVLVIKGVLKAPSRLEAHTSDYWIKVKRVNNFRITGGGVLDGEGNLAWQKNVCQKDPNCKNLPITLRLDYIENGTVENIKSVDSKNFHFNILECKNLTIKHVVIEAPAESPNTDGIHMGRSQGITILNTTIGTGDDCVSLGDGSVDVTIIDLTCGPGHGISVGSLGKYKNEEPVTGLVVKRCKLTNSDNGVRIKTWPGMYSNIASDMVFDDITMDNVSNPIIIDQMYCPQYHCNLKTQSKVKLSKIAFKNIRGTSFTPKAIQLICSKQFPCEKVDLASINLQYTRKALGSATAECINVKPRMTGKILPAGC